MKTKSLILEILIVLISLGISAYLIKHQMDIHKPVEDILLKTFIAAWMAPVLYWRMKSKILSSNHPNPIKPITIWQYFIVGFLISGILFEILVYYKIAERSIKNVAILWLIWMIIYGNYRIIAEPFQDAPVFNFFDNEYLKKKSKRFSGKVMVLGGILSVVLLLVLPENLSGYVLIVYFLSFGIAPFLYGKILQWRKVA
jgi:hypothetical protein